MTRTPSYLPLMLLGLIPFLLGGSCTPPPPHHDISGVWVNASWGPDKEMTRVNQDPVNLDIAMQLSAAIPVWGEQEVMPLSGTICVYEAADLGIDGIYEIDPNESTYVGVDYGGGRMDLTALHESGRRIEISQAMMHNTTPNKLDSAIIVFTTPDSEDSLVFSFKEFVRNDDVICEAAER